MDIALDMASPSPKIQITPEMVNLIAELEELKGRWTATQFLAPERLAALRRVATARNFREDSPPL